jgi:predicted phage-related endonuclease
MALLRGGELHSKIREYEQFANDVLKSDLQKTVELRAKYQQEVDELQQLQRNIKQLQEVRQSPQITEVS